MLRPTNLCLHQGDSWAATVTVLNADGTTPDLAGYTAQSQFRLAPADQEHQVAAELLGVVVPPNLISISLTAEQTTLLVDPAYRWDLQIISPTGEVTTILAGSVAITLAVTRIPPVEPPWLRRIA